MTHTVRRTRFDSAADHGGTGQDRPHHELDSTQPEVELRRRRASALPAVPAGPGRPGLWRRLRGWLGRAPAAPADQGPVCLFGPGGSFQVAWPRPAVVPLYVGPAEAGSGWGRSRGRAGGRNVWRGCGVAGNRVAP